LINSVFTLFTKTNKYSKNALVNKIGWRLELNKLLTFTRLLSRFSASLTQNLNNSNFEKQKKSETYIQISDFQTFKYKMH